MKESLYIYNSGTLVRKDNTLRFINQNDEKKDIPIERYSDIYIFGEVTVNSALLNILSQYGINIFLITTAFIRVHFIQESNFSQVSFWLNRLNITLMNKNVCKLLRNLLMVLHIIFTEISDIIIQEEKTLFFI